MYLRVDKAERNTRRVVGICVAVIAVAIYWITADGGASFWDCPEYITCASLLEVGHPPGNPVWMLAMRTATIPFPREMHAVVVNMCSGLMMALAVWCLYEIIYCMVSWLCGKIRSGRYERFMPKVSDMAAVCGASGALIFAFCDSTWYSAVEAEVYAMSTFLSALSVLLMIRWAQTEDSGLQIRLLILIAYIMGLSLGVHQLNLLCIPVLAMIYVYRRNPGRKCGLKVWTAILLSFAIVGIMLVAVLDGTLRFAEVMELLMVNRWHLPMFSGVIAAWVVVAGVLLTTGILAWRSRRLPRWVGTSAWMALMVFIGFSSFALILIRGYAAPPMNEGAPSDIFALQRYVSRNQYGSKPLIYGATPYSAPMLQEEWREEEKTPVYARYVLEKGEAGYVPVMPGARTYQRSRFMTPSDTASNNEVIRRGEGYIIGDYSYSRKTTPELDMWFPRITAGSLSALESYDNWAGMNRETMTCLEVSEALDTLGNPVGKMDADGKRHKKKSWRPTYVQNLRLLMTYQVYYMYLRYLLWNFVGRQNDIPSTGEIDHGNFITGLPAVDKAMVGTSELMPAEAWYANPGNRTYYGIPFILGIIGLVFLLCQGRDGKRLAGVIAMLFLMTGVAIVVYLNQSPGEPRERDYSFIVSYMAFCIWIAFGLVALSRVYARWDIPRPMNLVFMLILAVAVPLGMARKNFPDHDRSGRNEVSRFAEDILKMGERGVIFSYGDNFTFPLWYAREVEGRGRDFQIVDIAYLSTPEYVVNLMRQGHPSLKFTATPGDVAYGTYSFTRVAQDADPTPVPLIEALRELYAERDGAPEFRHSVVTLPGRTLADTLTINLRDMAGGGLIPFRKLMLLDIIATATQGNASATEAKADSSAVFCFMNQLPTGFHSMMKPALRVSTFADVYAPGQTDGTYLENLARTALAEGSDDSTGRPYLDPATASQYRRRRGALVRAARYLLDNGDTVRASAVTDKIDSRFPYSYIRPGNYTVADSTFHEGLEYVKLRRELAGITGDYGHADTLRDILTYLRDKGMRWSHYRATLPEWRRSALSNSSRRDILTLQRIKSDSITVLREL